MENETEFLMVMKSREALANEIADVVVKNHPYEVPEVLAMPIVAAFGKYADWVVENTREESKVW